MKLSQNQLGTYELENDNTVPEGKFVTMDLTDLIDTYNLIQEELKNRGILAK